MLTARRLEKLKIVASQRQKGVVVVLEDIHDPHNAAAIFRSCDAFGIQDIYLVFNKETPYDPRVIGKSSSSSANKWLNFIIFKSSAECVESLKKNNYTIFAAALSPTSKVLTEEKFTDSKIALCFGNEREGLSDELLAVSDKKLIIPMVGMVQSFNVSVACAIIVYEATRKRFQNPLLSQPSKQEIEKIYRSLKNRSE